MSHFFDCPYLSSQVELSEEREEHIIQNHPNTLPDYLEQLSETLANPDLVRPSKHDTQAFRFSTWIDTIRTGRYLRVITVSDLETKRHWIITAYTARKLAGGIS
jgi:hypothetical protein